MSLIGTLEQFALSNVLQRVEMHEKTGQLVLKQGNNWIEFSFREGRLLCIGPLRTSATLGERLLYDKVITAQSWQEARRSLGDAEMSETRVARALMDLGYVTRDQLRTWTIQKSTIVVRMVLAWSSGEVHFNEGTPPPSDRLLVSMSVTALIEAAQEADRSTTPATSPQPISQPLPSNTYQSTYTEPVEAIQLEQLRPSQAASQPISAVRPAISSLRPRPGMLPLQSTSTRVQQPAPMTPSPAIERVPTLTTASQFFEAAPRQAAPKLVPSLPVVPPTTETSAPVADATMFPSLLPDTEATGFPSLLSDVDDAAGFSSLLSDVDDSSFVTLSEAAPEEPAGPLMQPVPVAQPAPARRIDISFMRPEMVLIPVDLSSFRKQNPQIQLTPEQWRLLTYADGRTSLQVVCQDLGLSPEPVCLVAGELMAEGLIYVSPPDQLPPMQELSPVSRELIEAGFGNGFVSPGFGAANGTPWSAAVPAFRAPDTDQHLIGALPFETESQWGNGGNGATFIPGRGWVTAHQPAQPQYAAYAQAR